MDASAAAGASIGKLGLCITVYGLRSTVYGLRSTVYGHNFDASAFFHTTFPK